VTDKWTIKQEKDGTETVTDSRINEVVATVKGDTLTIHNKAVQTYSDEDFNRLIAFAGFKEPN
jgi:hypothetical protein